MFFCLLVHENQSAPLQVPQLQLNLIIEHVSCAFDVHTSIWCLLLMCLIPNVVLLLVSLIPNVSMEVHICMVVYLCYDAHIRCQGIVATLEILGVFLLLMHIIVEEDCNRCAFAASVKFKLLLIL